MSSPPPELDREQLKPRPGCWLFVLPVIMGIAILIAYGYLFATGMRGRPATGERPTITFVGCDEAKEVVAERVEVMGLGDPVWADTPDGFTLTTTLPSEPEVAAQIPATLAAPGVFETRDQDGQLVLANHVEGTSVNLGFLTIYATTLVQLDAEGTAALRDHMTANPDGWVAYVLDGKELAKRRNLPAEPRGRIELESKIGTEKEQMQTAAEWSVVIGTGALPCPLTYSAATISR